MPKLRPLHTVLAELAYPFWKTVLVRAGEEETIGRLSVLARRGATTEPEDFRFWWEIDPHKCLAVMEMTERGPEVYAVQKGCPAPAGLHGAVPKRRPVRSVFEGRRYTFGKAYSWEMLPSETQKDALRQAEDIAYVYGRQPEELEYRLDLMPHGELIQVLERVYGADLERKLQSVDVGRMARSIEERGLLYPPIVDEGWKRALALASLGMDMPFFSVVPPFEMPPPSFVPSLEGFSMG